MRLFGGRDFINHECTRITDRAAEPQWNRSAAVPSRSGSARWSACGLAQAVFPLAPAAAGDSRGPLWLRPKAALGSSVVDLRPGR
jgi:hypothetical protein